MSDLSTSGDSVAIEGQREQNLAKQVERGWRDVRPGLLLSGRSLRRACAGIVLISCLADASASAATQPPHGAVSTVLLQADHSWDGSPYKKYPDGQPQLTVLKIEIPPHTTLPWHTHPMPNAAYVISGTLHVESMDGRHRKTLHAGDTLPEMVGIAHRGRTDDTGAELIVFYAGTKSMPTMTKAPQRADAGHIESRQGAGD
jgi:quercetin dioxygenase-like cupin family protein